MGLAASGVKPLDFTRDCRLPYKALARVSGNRTRQPPDENEVRLFYGT